jgi:hypothetical protein
MQDSLFDPANEWHEYKGCRLLRARAVFTARQGFVYIDHPHVKEIHLIDLTDPPIESGSEECGVLPHNNCSYSTAMVVGYIVLSTRTTLAVFRGILPGTTRFFFLSLPLLRFVREKRNPTPAWCAGILRGMQRLIENNFINKGSAACTQNMSGYYTGLACFVLFDARGAVVVGSGFVYTCITVCAAALLLSLKFIPSIWFRPQQLVDIFCEDILCIISHAVCIGMILDPELRHGCALHSMCFVLQQRFMGRMPSLTTETVVHTLSVLFLVAAYTHGPRITDVQRFMLSAVCPHALELLAQLLARVHRVGVIATTTD